jgi:hypothetical protein
MFGQMNYAVVILTFVFIVATSYWFIRGHKYYTGPRTRAHVVDGHIVAEATAPAGASDAEKAQPAVAAKNGRTA